MWVECSTFSLECDLSVSPIEKYRIKIFYENTVWMECSTFSLECDLSISLES